MPETKPPPDMAVLLERMQRQVETTDAVAVMLRKMSIAQDDYAKQLAEIYLVHHHLNHRMCHSSPHHYWLSLVKNHHHLQI